MRFGSGLLAWNRLSCEGGSGEIGRQALCRVWKNRSLGKAMPDCAGVGKQDGKEKRRWA